MLHIPLLRHGKPYRSLDFVRVPHYRTREPFVEISQANVGLIRRDLLDLDDVRARLAGIFSAELFRIFIGGAEHFLYGSPPPRDRKHTPAEYAGPGSATTPPSPVLCPRKNRT